MTFNIVVIYVVVYGFCESTILLLGMHICSKHKWGIWILYCLAYISEKTAATYILLVCMAFHSQIHL